MPDTYSFGLKTPIQKLSTESVSVTSSPPYDPLYWGRDDSLYPYSNHTLLVDVKSPTFRVIYSDFKNRTNDLIIEPTSTQTLFPDGKVEIIEGKYRSLIHNDENMTVESFMYEWNEKSTSWYDGDCYNYKSERLNETYLNSMSKSCNNGSYLYFYSEPQDSSLPADESYLAFSESLSNGTTFYYYANGTV